MAAKEKRIVLSKDQIKQIQLEGYTDLTKSRRGRTSTPSVLTDGKTYTEPKSPAKGRKRIMGIRQDGQVTPNTRKRRSAVEVEEEHEAAKTPPHTGFKLRKTFLEKELEDILENATGRNTPSTPRNRKTNERDDENVEFDKLARTRRGGSVVSDVVDDKNVLGLSKLKKANEKDVDDDNLSVRSFSTLRTRRNIDKDVDDDALSVRSMSSKSKKSEVNNEDSASVASLARSNSIKKVGRKKKTVPVAKKKSFLKRGRPKKGQADGKGKTTSKKKSSKKTVDDLVEGRESKRLLNKTLKYQNMMGTQRRLRSAMLLKKQKLRKTNEATDENSNSSNPRGFIVAVEDGEDEMVEVDEVGNDKERLKLESQSEKNELPKSDESEVINIMTEEPKKESPGSSSKRKYAKRDGGKKGDGKFVYRDKANEFFFYPEEETPPKSDGDKMSQKIKPTKIKRAKKLSNESKKRKRVPGIHFETTSSPDDSSVIIVQPRLGPKMKYARMKQVVVNKPARKIRPKEVVPSTVLPISSTATVSNFNQIGNSYLVQSIPNFKLLATNSTVSRSYNSSATVNPNFDSTRPVSPNNLPYIQDPNQALTSLGPKIWPSDVIVTPSGIVLSSSKLISGVGNQQTPSICVNSPNPGLLPLPSNSNILYSAQSSVGNVSTTQLFYQNSSNIIQPQTCTKTATAILLERPESLSTSVVSTMTGTVVLNTDGGVRLNGASDAGAVDADAGAVDADAGAVDADAGAVDADAGAVDADAGAVDADVGAADTDVGVADADADVADADVGATDADVGVTDTDADVADADVGVTDTDADVADADVGAADTDADVADADVGVADADVGVADADAGAVDAGKQNGYSPSMEKALERGENDSSSSSSEYLPTIPVAENVNELLMLNSKTSDDEKTLDKTDEKNNINGKLDKLPGKSDGKHDSKKRRRTLRNVRQNHSSLSELTFSEPENSCCEKEEPRLYKTISCERLNEPLKMEENNAKVLLQLGSEPMPISESIAPFETASAILLGKSDKLEDKLKIDVVEEKECAKGAIYVCSFSKENAEALRELGLDSDADQTKSEVEEDMSPEKINEDTDSMFDDLDHAKKEKIKEEVDNVLKEMPNRKTPNLLRKSECFNLSKRKMELNTPLVPMNNDYLSKSPSKPPTVIDKLLERNKSLKKAEQESKHQKSVRNLSENLDNCDKSDQKRKRTLRESRKRKYTKREQRRLATSKRFADTNSECKVYERRGSNPELYSNNYLTTESDGSNENVPLSRALEICESREKYQRRASRDYESIQKVAEGRNSLPVASNKSEDGKKAKTENIKTILIRSSTPLTNKSHGGEQQTRVINIVTEDDGSKKGQNLMEEIGIEIGKEAMEKMGLSGEKERSTSVESSENSETESLKKLMEGITVSKRKTTKELPSAGEKSSLKVEKLRLSLDKKSSEEKKSATVEETPEDLVTKETILSALGLQRTAPQNVQKKESNSSCQSDSGNYTGTLKTVIKIQRQEKKGNSKAPMKMIYKASSSSSSVSGQNEEHNIEQDMDTASKDETEEEGKNGSGKAKSLVIPEKASSFSIHPGRLCSDVCTYCFGKFGLLDTPCHIAQLKDDHKRRNILAAETHLLADSCLCDACYRHVDKKSNCPTFTEKKTDKRKFQGRKSICCARNCNADSQHNLRRKWFSKLKKSIGRKVVLDPAKLEKLQPAHLVTLCNRHFYWVDYFMSCGICKKRLNSSNMYRVGPDIIELNAALSADGIPTILTEKRFLCKICHCYASIRIKCKDPSEMSSNQCQFYEACRRRILQCHKIEIPDSENEGDRDNNRTVQKNAKRTRKSAKPTATVTSEGSKSDNEMEFSMEELDKGNEGEKDSEMKEVSHMNIPPKTSGNLDFGGVSITPSTTEVNPTQIHVKMGNLNIGALGNLNIGQDVRHGTRSSDMQCFPTEAELALRAHFDLQPSAEDEIAKIQRKGFEKCTTTMQFSPETKNLFYSLQMPYGNHSSFFRHLILLEKYFRNGDLVISRNADPKAITYISSIQNRVRSYEGVHNPVKKHLDIPPSLSIVPQPVKTEVRHIPELQPSVIQSRPFTLTPMPSNSSFPKSSPLSHMQATVQNIPSPSNQSIHTQGFVKSLLKSNNPARHPKPDISITSVPSDHPMPVRIGKSSTQTPTALTSKIQENLRNLASKSESSNSQNEIRAVILNRTVGGQKQSLVQVTTGNKTIHLTLHQFRRIQQMQMRKKIYLEKDPRVLKLRKELLKKMTSKMLEENFDIKNLSPELEIQEIRQAPSSTEIFPLISEVRSLAGEESWEKSLGEFNDQTNDSLPSESLPKIPKALSVSVTKIPSTESPPKDHSFESTE